MQSFPGYLHSHRNLLVTGNVHNFIDSHCSRAPLFSWTRKANDIVPIDNGIIFTPMWEDKEVVGFFVGGLSFYQAMLETTLEGKSQARMQKKTVRM